jgi:hypothetical protein
MFGTCYKCLATCTRVFLVERHDEVGMCATCVARTYLPWDERDLTYLPRHRVAMAVSA